MRIAYFTESLYPHVDGVSRTLARLFATLQRRGEEFVVFSPFVPGPEVAWRDRVRPVRSVRFPLHPDYRVSLPVATAAVRSELERFRPELVHVVSPTPMAAWAQRWAAAHGVPVVGSFHTHFVSYFRFYGAGRLERLGWRALRRFYGRCRRVYAPSPSVVRELEAHGLGDVALWSRGIDLARFSPGFRDPALRARLDVDDDTPLLLLVSRLVKYKDLADLVAADRELRRRGVAFRLALVGDGPMREQLERDLPEATFAGHRAGVELARWYASADVFVFPSTTETLGNVVLEAMASGLPPVVVDRGGPQDLVEHGATGFVARANDVGDLADHLERLLRDPALRGRMGAAAQAAAAPRDWEEINGALLDDYRAVVAAAP